MKYEYNTTTSTFGRQFFGRQARLVDNFLFDKLFLRQFFVRQTIFTTIFCATHFLCDKFTVNGELRRERRSYLRLANLRRACR